MNQGSRRAVLAALCANLGIACAKFVGFFFTGAASLLAEAVHSCADTGNQALLLLGGARAQRAPTRHHPFGYGRERYFWAFVVALVLFALGSLFSIYEGVQKLLHPHELVSPQWGVGILVLAMIFEGFAFWNAAREANRVRGSHSWWEYIRHARSPELPVVLLEDLGALLGLLLALVGLGLATVTGDPKYDALGSVAIGVLLGGIAVVLAAEMKSLLIGESAEPAQRQAIVRILEEDAEVRRLLRLQTQHLGPDELLVCAKLELSPELDVGAVVATLNRVEKRLREQVGIVGSVYLEPELEGRLAPLPSAGGAR